MLYSKVPQTGSFRTRKMYRLTVLETGSPKSRCWQIHAVTVKSLQSCPTVQSHRQQPTRFLCPWDSPGKNTGVGCHFLLQCMKVKSESEVAQSCPTLRDPMDCSPPGSSTVGFSRQECWSGVLLPSLKPIDKGSFLDCSSFW